MLQRLSAGRLFTFVLLFRLSSPFAILGPERRPNCFRQSHSSQRAPFAHLRSSEVQQGLFAKSRAEVSIQTAQLLLDKRRHEELTRDLQKQFPFVPPAVLEGCVNVVADAVLVVTPEKLQKALRPGVMAKRGPEISREITRFVLKQPIMDAIPVLNADDKANLVESMVNMAMDFLLRDAQIILASPEVRLEALEAEVRNVKRLMGPWRLFLFRLRRLPRIVKAGMVSGMIVAGVYQQQGSITPNAFLKTAWSSYHGIVDICTWLSLAAKDASSVLARIGGFLLKASTWAYLKFSHVLSRFR